MFFTIVTAVELLIFLVGLRFYYITQVVRSHNRHRNNPAKTLIVLGSGGHTAEMMEIVKRLDRANYSPRYYVLASTDQSSAVKVLDHEEPATAQHADYRLFRMQRSRHVGQSYVSAVFTTIRSVLEAIPLVGRLQPDLILCNGPGTCVPVCLIAFVFKVLGLLKAQSKIVFVESFCRVNTISLTGRILIYFVDSFVVQWPTLIAYSSKVEYFGQLT